MKTSLKRSTLTLHPTNVTLSLLQKDNPASPTVKNQIKSNDEVHSVIIIIYAQRSVKFDVNMLGFVSMRISGAFRNQNGTLFDSSN